MNDLNINDKLNSTFDIEKLKKMKKKISILNENEHIEIFNIIKQDGLKYTENNNGIFINMKKICDDTLDNIDHFITFCNKNNHMLSNDKKIRNSYNRYIIDT